MILSYQRTPREKKEVPIKMKNQLLPPFKEQFKHIFPHVRRRDLDSPAKVQFKANMEMKNTEGQSSYQSNNDSSERNKFSQTSYSESNKVYYKFSRYASEQKNG
jgi:hypothetical protein